MKSGMVEPEGNMSIHRVVVEHAGDREGVPVYRMVCKEHSVEANYTVIDLASALIDHLEESYDSKWGGS